MPLSKHWITDPPFWPWGFFVVHTIIIIIFVLSLYTILLSQSNIVNKEYELIRLKLLAISEERLFHANLNKSILVRDELLREASVKAGIPAEKVDIILKKDLIIYKPLVP